MDEEYFINEQETKEGYEKMLKVIKRLINDSKLCLDNSRYSASVSLSILTLEETAKADFFRLKIKESKGITKKEWKDLTAGGDSHIKKLNWFLDKKEKGLERWTEEDIASLHEVNSFLGFGVNNNKEDMKKEIELFRMVVAKFNIIKQSCFYTSWNINYHEWKYFDSMFPDKIKIVMANYLFIESKRNFLSLQFAKVLPDKKFVDYTQEDWDRARNSNIRKEIEKTYTEGNKKLKDFGLLINALYSLN